MRKEKYIDMSLTDEQLAPFGIKSFPETEQYIQVKDVRYTLDEFNRVGDFLLGRGLSDNQQVLSGAELIGVIYSQLLEDFGFGYIEKDLWMIAEKLSEKIANADVNFVMNVAGSWNRRKSDG